MATTTATITLASADLLSDNLSLSATQTLHKAGTTTGLDGIQYEMGKVVIPSSDTNNILIDSTASGVDKASRVYIINKNTNEAHYVQVAINGAVLGRLYSGDWMFIPWNQSSSGADIEVVCPADLGTSCDVEYALFHQGKSLSAA